MAVFFETSAGVKPHRLRKNALKQWIAAVAASHGKQVGEVSYRFCSDEEILQVNNQYLNHDYYTDIITFDYTEGEVVSGDIFISLDTVASNAELYKTDIKDELHRVIIHGLLHLCGLKDKSAAAARKMRAAEDEALKTLQI
ncbi:MAG: rRNA maturation RNase YbeY [Tannerella sp.]|jgi:rRNA maturation RNase YbeY|nr:rRNA maturation RNase YbeY [Tannerella sp.]